MRILIIGPNSYIAQNFIKLVDERCPDWKVDTLSVRDNGWKTYDYSPYDSVLYCAACVHKKESPQLAETCRRLNCDIPGEIAQLLWSQAPASQFIFLSTMAVFGLEGRVGKTVCIDSATPLSPKTMYAKTKLAGEEKLCAASQVPLHWGEPRRALAIFRPPMVYGADCPGNYQRLKAFVLTFRIFPTLRNRRSMIHIDTLTDRLLNCVIQRQAGTFHPREASDICTADLVRDIAAEANRPVYFCPLLNPLVRLGALFHPAFHKVWGGLVYHKEMDA